VCSSILTGVVFIDAATARIGGHTSDRSVWTDAEPIIQIKQHRRTLRRSEEEIAKFTEGLRPNGIAIVGRCQPTIGSFGGKNIEMVVPEVDHDFVELALAVHSAQETRLLELEDDEARRVHFA
jgi:hypothetical protein